MDAIVSLDRLIFITINHLPHTVISDTVALFLSGIGQWGVIWFVLAVYLFIREENRDHLFFIPFLCAGFMSALLSEGVIKMLVSRPRPTLDIGAIILTTPGNYSFPSTHAAIAWAMAVVLSNHEPGLKFWFYTLAGAISLSRIYLGVHYPIDVIGGAVFGWGIGLVANTITFPLRNGQTRQATKKKKPVKNV